MPIIYDDYNGRIKADQSGVGTLTTNCGNDAKRNGVKTVEASGIYTGVSEKFMRDPLSGISRCLKAKKCDAGVVETTYRVRKLTPKECWRLMDFDDSDFEKAKAKGISDSQLYKQAGNSIVVAVLEAIFGEMI